MRIRTPESILSRDARRCCTALGIAAGRIADGDEALIRELTRAILDILEIDDAELEASYASTVRQFGSQYERTASA